MGVVWGCDLLSQPPPLLLLLLLPPDVRRRHYLPLVVGVVWGCDLLSQPPPLLLLLLLLPPDVSIALLHQLSHRLLLKVNEELLSVHLACTGGGGGQQRDGGIVNTQRKRVSVATAIIIDFPFTFLAISAKNCSTNLERR